MISQRVFYDTVTKHGPSGGFLLQNVLNPYATGLTAHEAPPIERASSIHEASERLARLPYKSETER